MNGVLGVVACVTALASLLVSLRGREASVEILEVQNLNIRTEDGRRVISLGVNADGGGFLMMYDSSGKTRVELRTADDSVDFGLFDPSKRPSLKLVSDTEGARLSLRDSGGDSLVDLAARAPGKPYGLKIRGSGSTKVLIGIDEAGVGFVGSERACTVLEPSRR
jgi:hypothetical protein